MIQRTTKSCRWLLVSVLSATAFVATVPAMTAPAHAQGADLKELLAGAKYPLTLKLKDLDAEWRRLSVSAQNDTNPWAMLFSIGGDDVFYTRSQTVTVGTETFIVAYRPPVRKVDFTVLMRGPGAAQPPLDPLTPDTQLGLSYLNLRMVASLNAIEPFNLQREVTRRERDIAEARERMAQMAGPQGPAAQNANQMSMSNLKQVSLAMMQYVQDHDEAYPKMEDAEAVKALLMPYAMNETVFMHPATRELYQPNPALSGKKLTQVADPVAMVLFYEASAAADGTRGVAYADGHVKRVAEAEWPQIKRASRIP